MRTYLIDQLHFTTQTETPILEETFVKTRGGDVCEYSLTIQFREEVSPQRYSLFWEEDQVDVLGFWSSKSGFVKSITPDWAMRGENSRTASGMPLLALYNNRGQNRLTVSLSDAANACTLAVGVVEETGRLRFRIDFFDAISPRISAYKVVIRMDRRSLSAGDAIQSVRAWWDELGYRCAYTPLSATLPMYSTWYNFHQQIKTEEILEECKIAKTLGMDSVIVDDGWQTDDNARGYAYCGDWNVCKSKIPDMKAFVDTVHEIGMKFLVWFSVPFVGFYSEAYPRFKGMYLRELPHMSAAVLDPRFKEVRDYLSDTYCSAILEYGLDGLKLDFIDEFMLSSDSSTEYDKMDCVSVEEGVRKLLQEVSCRTREINPEFMIEFRQSYVGPSVGQYGNIFRVADCPNDVLSNRIGSLNLRLTSGSTAVHSDPLMWNREDTVEAVAQQLLSTMFAVPQISVRLSDISSEQKRFLSSYLAFWREHHDTLVNGKIEVFGMEANYTMASASKAGERVSALYQSIVVNEREEAVHFLLNATGKNALYVENRQSCSYEVYDPFGDIIRSGVTGTDVSKIEVPIGGRLKLVHATVS